MLSFFSIFKNDSFLVRGHSYGAIMGHKAGVDGSPATILGCIKPWRAQLRDMKLRRVGIWSVGADLCSSSREFEMATETVLVVSNQEIGLLYSHHRRLPAQHRVALALLAFVQPSPLFRLLASSSLEPDPAKSTLDESPRDNNEAVLRIVGN
ncbi:hypothetical protein Droror1_Dr00025605 [Drosera rotundifolia]